LNYIRKRMARRWSLADALRLAQSRRCNPRQQAVPR